MRELYNRAEEKSPRQVSGATILQKVAYRSPILTQEMDGTYRHEIGHAFISNLSSSMSALLSSPHYCRTDARVALRVLVDPTGI
jgi:hypothetical protein